jgi:hypothetical protein
MAADEGGMADVAFYHAQADDGEVPISWAPGGPEDGRLTLEEAQTIALVEIAETLKKMNEALWLIERRGR